MAKLSSLICLHLLALFGSSLRSLAGKEYRAAVYEHEPYFIPDGSTPSRKEALRIMRTNTAVYSEKANTAGKQGAQIIVFPEDGIYGIFYTRERIQSFLEPIPDVSNLIEPWVPCTSSKRVANTEILQELSCIALNNSIALVANMGDIQYCTKSTDPNCPEDGRYQFNTDVVFDTDGRLLAKYHKQNLFHEKQFNTPVKCQFVTFVTSFEVRFGVFTCFDMLFKSPAEDLVRIYGVKNIVFPTAWFAGFPLLNAVQYQQAWSRTNCVNLIAANLLISVIPDSSGSGIYACGEVKVYTFGNEPWKKHLLISTLQDIEEEVGKTWWKLGYPRKGIDDQETHQKIREFHVPHITETFKGRVLNDVYTLTKLVEPEGDKAVCGDKMCCYLTYKLSGGSKFTESFALGVFSGNQDPEGFYLKVCVLFKCASSDDQSCGKPVDESETVFQSFLLSGDFASNETVFAGVLSSGVTLSQPDKVKFTGDAIVSEEFEQPLVTAALVGRLYSKDKPGF